MAANPYNATRVHGQQPARPGDRSAAGLAPQPQITWHAETNISNKHEAAEVARTRTETKAAYDVLKAQGASSNHIMGRLLHGKRGAEFHATKMVVQAEKNKARAAEFKMLFPEIPKVPNTLRQSDVNKLLKAAGCKDKTEVKGELARRRQAKGHRASVESLDDEAIMDEVVLSSRKRNHGEEISSELPISMSGILHSLS